MSACSLVRAANRAADGAAPRLSFFAITTPNGAFNSPESIALSKALKKRGWKFVGPTTVYAFMQAMGLVNDHVADCVIGAKVERARKSFKRPIR